MGRMRSPSSSSVVGIDLAGVAHRPTGFCRLEGAAVEVRVLHGDDEICAATVAAGPALVLIDAPLSLPRGRSTIEDRTGPHLRECDRELLRRRIRFFPLTLGPMRVLTVRGIGLADRLRATGFDVREGYPGASQDLLRIPRKGAGIAQLQRRLRGLGLRGDLDRRALTHDELDAVTLAVTARRYLEGRGIEIGDPAEGTMVLPGAARGVGLRASATRGGGPSRPTGGPPRSPLEPRPGRARRSGSGRGRRRARRTPPPRRPRRRRT